MTYKRFLSSLRHIAIGLAVIGLMGASQSVSAQKVRTPTKPVVVFAPSYVCDTDFTGDLQNDIVFFNAETTKWVKQSADGTTTENWFGAAGDLPIAGDFDGDNIVDIAVVHNQDGFLTWQILQSTDGATSSVQWGADGDVPVKGDYDGDGRTDIAVWRASEGTWYVRRSSTGVMLTIVHGLPWERAIPGDYDGDGKTDVAVFRISNRTLYFIGSLDTLVHTQTWTPSFVKSQETFVPADYDGDGRTDFAIFNARSGVWTIRQSSDGLYRTETFSVDPPICDLSTQNPCIENDFAFPSDYDNDGKADPAIWNSKGGDMVAIGSMNGEMKIETRMSIGELPVSAYFMTN